MAGFPCRGLVAAAFFLLAAADLSEAAIPPDVAREILIREQSRNADDGYLVGLTKHDDPAVRARAYRALGRLQVPALLSELTRGIADSDLSVRLEAAYALGQLFDPVAEPAIIGVLHRETSPEFRVALVEALGKCGSDASVAVLTARLEDKDPQVARAAAIGLGVLGQRDIDIQSAGTALAKALRSTDPELQWRAGFAVQRGKVQSAGAGVQFALKSKEALPVIFACRAARAIGTAKMGEGVVPLLRHEDWRVRVEAVNTLAELKLHIHTGQVSILLDDLNDHVLLSVIRAMGELASGGGLGRFGDLEGSSDWRVRAAIMRAKAAGSGDGALNEVLQASHDANWRVRVAAAEAYGTIQSEQALVLLKEMTTDESPQVLTAVVNALIEFPQIHAVEVIRTFLSNHDPAVLTSAATGSGQRFDLSATPGLVAAYDRLQSPVDTEIMVAVLGALKAILTATPENDPVGTLEEPDRAKAFALLEAARHDPDVNVARAAAEALSEVKGEPVEPVTQPTAAVPSQLDLDLVASLESAVEDPIARLVTSRGTVAIRLRASEAPGTVANFITLARSGYYNGLTFHRVVADFVTQGGDPRGDGWGGPGYAIRCEINPLHYETGTVGMALSGKDTGGSQFFVTHSPQPHLDGRYTIFGEVIDGLDVLLAIQVGDTIDEVQLEGI